MPELRPGDVFVNHRIEGLAGRGGMGVVYRATDLDLDRVVALKVIAPALADEPDFRARFVAESKAAASIEHPNVIPVYYAGDEDGVLYIVMRFVDGPDLRALVRAQGSLDADRAAQIISQVGGALDAAHQHGLVHRDVKPANVLLDADDHAYLTDFGLTKRAASTGALSRSGGWVGTLGFVAPEQIRGERVDGRTDVYALGCVLVHALTGDAPYLRESDEATLWAHLNAPPPTDRVPQTFAGVVARALSKDPADRFPSAGDLGRATLAAAGRSNATGPERIVARGAAAPEGTPQTLPTARADPPAQEGDTRASPEQIETAVSARRGDSHRGRLVLAFAVLLLAAAAIAALLTTGDDDRVAETTTAEKPAPARADRPRGIATRPNSITVRKNRVWVLSGSDGKIVVLDATTGRTVRRVTIQRGGAAVASGFGSIWALKANTGSLLRIRPSTGKRDGAATQISVPGVPAMVATGEGAIWVGVQQRKSQRDSPGASAEALVKIDPSTMAQESVIITDGVRNIAVGEGAVWVANRFSPNVVRVDPDDLSEQSSVTVGTEPHGIAVGEGAVWVAIGGDEAIKRINPRSLSIRTIDLPAIPARVAVGGGSVWVTAREADQLYRIDPDRRRVRERIRTGAQPFGVDVANGGSVWLTLLAEDGGSVQRVPFSRGGD
ncbi:MAG: protein kinase domain-containing protein [Solirubrobacteraceae bacterium]